MRRTGLLVLACASALAAAWAGAPEPAAAAGAVKPSAHVELYANPSPGATLSFQEIDASGQLAAEPFEIPSGRVLVVTDVIVVPNAVDGVYAGSVSSPGGSESRLRFRLDTGDQEMLHLPLETGLVFSAAPDLYAYGSNPGACGVRLLGTLSKAN